MHVQAGQCGNQVSCCCLLWCMCATCSEIISSKQNWDVTSCQLSAFLNFGFLQLPNSAATVQTVCVLVVHYSALSPGPMRQWASRTCWTWASASIAADDPPTPIGRQCALLETWRVPLSGKWLQCCFAFCTLPRECWHVFNQTNFSR